MKTILYFYESAFMMWRRRLAGIYTIARAEGWHVESVDMGELDHGVLSVLHASSDDVLNSTDDGDGRFERLRLTGRVIALIWTLP